MLKRSKGLKSRIIEFTHFNRDLTILDEDSRLKLSIVMKKVMEHVNKARKNYRLEKKNFATENKFAPNEFWDEVIKKAHELGIGLIGFASVDENLIFEIDYVGGIDVLYENAIVLGMEMDYNNIEDAPDFLAAYESMRIYAELGEATNKLADFIRSKGYRAIVCHPLGGPILYPPMAVKANLGEIGRNGLLVSKKYGPRQRLSMIATNAYPLPEIKHEELRITEYCEKCGICIKKCPANAILNKPIKRNGLITHIDGSKCIEYFYKTLGCSICIKVCPFHKLGYEKVIKSL